MDKNYHINYCEQVADMTYINDLVNYRKAKLKQCLAKDTSMGNCETYANRAKWQSGAAIFLGCSFANSGGRWAYDYDAHLNWCNSAALMSYADAEDKARRNELSGCVQ